MPRRITRMLGLAAVAFVYAAVVQAQEKGKHRNWKDDDIRRRDADYGFRYGRNAPPGLAKKPGHMPPGQYKKRYRTYEGASVLSEIMRRRGYNVVRIVPAGETRYVYYRRNDGRARRAIVQPGADQLTFNNVPTQVLQSVMNRLY